MDANSHEAQLSQFGSLKDACKDTLIFALTRQPLFEQIPIMRESFLAEIRRRQPLVLIIDMAKAERFNGAGLAVCAEVLRAMPPGGRVFLLNVGPQVRGFIEISDLRDMFKIVDDLPEVERRAIMEGIAVPVDQCPESNVNTVSAATLAREGV